MPRLTRQDHLDRSYMYAPYGCKLPHRSFRTWIARSASRSILFYGGRALREAFCAQVWPSLGGIGACGIDPLTTVTIRHGDGDPSTVSFLSHASTTASELESHLAALDTATRPSHVIVGLDGMRTMAEFLQSNTQALDTLQKLVPDADIVVRTPARSIQALVRAHSDRAI